MTDFLSLTLIGTLSFLLLTGNAASVNIRALSARSLAYSWLFAPVTLVCITSIYLLQPALIFMTACDQLSWTTNVCARHSATLSVLVSAVITLTIFFTLMLNKQTTITTQVLANIAVLLCITLCFLHTQSLVILLITFESLLLVSLNLLRLTSKSERIGEAISEMFMWTLFGSFFLLAAFFLLAVELGTSVAFDSQFLTTQHGCCISGVTCLFFFIGFGVKIPVWPFLSWLLKAHVEASVEFSILLSGFIVKLGVLGVWRVLDAVSPNWFYIVVVGVCCVGIIDATLRLFAQNDLKKIVALTTVIEMNWLNICFIFGDMNLVFLANYLLVAHCFTTSAEFLVVEYVSKRYGTRDFWQVVGLWHKAPLLWYISFLVVLTTMGFPGTSIFFAKFLFLATILSYSTFLFVTFLIVFFLVLPLFFIRLWVPVWFGLNSGINVFWFNGARSLYNNNSCVFWFLSRRVSRFFFFSIM